MPNEFPTLVMKGKIEYMTKQLSETVLLFNMDEKIAEILKIASMCRPLKQHCNNGDYNVYI